MKKKIKLYLLSFALFAAILGVVFGVAEVCLRGWISWHASESRNHVIQTAGMPITFKPNYQGRIWDIPFRTNRYGFRGEPDFPRQPADGEIRVLSLGDSIGFGLGIAAADHYTKVAERRLQPDLPHQRLRIVNAGGQGYSPSGYAVFLRETGLDLKPSLVIIETELCNDVTDEALLRTVLPKDGSEMPLAYRGGRYVVSWDGNLLATYSKGPSLLERTYVYTDLLRRLLNLRFRLFPNQPFLEDSAQTYYTLGFDRPLLTPERIEQGWRRLFDSLRGTRDYLEERNVPMLLLIMPSRHIYDSDRAPRHSEFAAQLVRRADEMAEERSLPYYDMTRDIAANGGTELYFDFAHLTEVGNRVVGESLAQILRRRYGIGKPADGAAPLESSH